MFVGRGTMAQSYFVATVEAVYLMHHVRVYPYVRKQHNQIDSAGHMALVLTYAVTLILRNPEEDDAFVDEIFPREGYGWFIVFVYVVFLPGPTLYKLFKGQSGDDEVATTTTFDENPLARDTGADEWDFDSTQKLTEPTSLSKIAKMQREQKEIRSENEALRTEIVALRASAGAASDEGSGDGSTPTYVPPAPIETDPAKIELKALQTIQDDESLAEEIRESAKKNIAELTAARLLESAAVVEGVNRAARNRKTAVAAAWKSPEVQREEFRTWLGENRSDLSKSPVCHRCFFGCDCSGVSQYQCV